MHSVTGKYRIPLGKGDGETKSDSASVEHDFMIKEAHATTLGALLGENPIELSLLCGQDAQW